MSKNDIAVAVSSVSKDFEFARERSNSIKSAFVRSFKRKKIAPEIHHALKDISFEVKQGEFFGIVGRNGSGKSTLLKILAGIYQPTRGKVTYQGKLVPFIELGVGFNPELTGRENVYLNGAMLGFSEDQVSKMYDDIVEFAEIEDFMDQKLKNYSSGMQVRLAFSMATRAQADILLIDEVLAVGDADFQRKCFEYFHELKRKKKTVVFVSHDMNAIREYCDRAVLVDDSKIIFSGSAEQAAKEYTRLFLPNLYKAQEEEARVKRHNELKGSAKENKWGVGGVDVVAPSLSKRIYTNTDRLIILEYVIMGDKGFRGQIIPGFTIKGPSGEGICGTNTDILKAQKEKITLRSGGSVKCKWIIPNILGEGKFTVDIAVLSGANFDTLQWWEDAIDFRSINEENTPYPVSPNIRFSMSVPD